MITTHRPISQLYCLHLTRLPQEDSLSKRCTTSGNVSSFDHWALTQHTDQGPSWRILFGPQQVLPPPLPALSAPGRMAMSWFCDFCALSLSIPLFTAHFIKSKSWEREDWICSAAGFDLGRRRWPSLQSGGWLIEECCEQFFPLPSDLTYRDRQKWVSNNNNYYNYNKPNNKYRNNATGINFVFRVPTAVSLPLPIHVFCLLRSPCWDWGMGPVIAPNTSV